MPTLAIENLSHMAMVNPRIVLTELASSIHYIIVQDDAAAAADDDDAARRASLTTAIVTADHLYSLSRRIKSFLRHELKSAVGPSSSITIHGY